MEKLTHWKNVTQSSAFIGAYAFQPGERKTVTITGSGQETVFDPSGHSEEKGVLYFQEEKPLILNSTNGKTIADVLGTPYIEEWAGRQIVLAVEKVRSFRGEMVEAVRVQHEQAADPFSAEACSECGEIIEPAGGMTARQVADGTRRNYGVVLCYQCGMARRSSAKKKPSKTAAAAPEAVEDVQHEDTPER